MFIKYPIRLDDTNTYEFIDMYTHKEYFLHLLEEPVDDYTWFRIKQPGTYTMHFDIIGSSYVNSSHGNSFSFRLHTRGEIIHFSEHNPKRDINLEKGENCVLTTKDIPEIIRAGSKIYVYYNI